jgi:predicted NBD/HSP70 family sugar kinase
MEAGMHPRRSVRRINRANMLDLVRQHEPVARLKLAKLMDLTPASVTNLANELIAAGLMRQAGLMPNQEQRAGRPSQLIELAAEARLTLAMYLGVARPAVGIVDLRGKVIAARNLPLELAMMASRENLDAIIRHARSFLQAQNLSPGRLLGVGVGIPNIPWGSFPVSRIVGEAFDCPVLVEHIVRTMTLSEYVHVFKRSLHSMIFVDISYGIGAGIIFNGELWRGATGRAGELGHVYVTDRPVVCRCGNRGCLEAVAGERAVVQQARLIMPELIDRTHEDSLDHVIQAARQGNEAAVDLFKQTGELLGLGLADLINVINPQLIVIGGKMVQVGSLILDAVYEVIRQRSQSGRDESIQVCASRLGPQAGLVGAATCLMADYFYSTKLVL